MIARGAPARWRAVVLACLLLLVGFGFVGAMHAASFATSPDGLHLHVWDSDVLMQTLPAAQLKQTPLGSLWYDHIHPPMLDAVRALVLQLTDAPDPGALLMALDRRLYVLWSALCSLLAWLVFRWVRDATGSVATAVGAWAVWLVHPAPLLYSTLLESTLLSSLLATWLLYSVWTGRWRQATAAAVLLFFTRTTYQWYFFGAFLAAGAVAGWGRRRLLRVAACVLLLVGPFVLKQYALFGTLETTTFAGYHAAGILWYEPAPGEVEARRATLEARYPARADAYSGGDPYNTRKQWEDNLIYKALVREQARDHPLRAARQVLRSFVYNGIEYWGPSARFVSGNTMVNSLPWKGVYDAVFGRRIFPLVLLLCVGLWARRLAIEIRQGRPEALPRLRVAGALAILIGYTMLITHLCNRSRWTEAVRLKFFLEPAFYVFATTQLVAEAKALACLVSGRLRAGGWSSHARA